MYAFFCLFSRSRCFVQIARHWRSIVCIIFAFKKDEYCMLRFCVCVLSLFYCYRSAAASAIDVATIAVVMFHSRSVIVHFAFNAFEAKKMFNFILVLSLNNNNKSIFQSLSFCSPLAISFCFFFNILFELTAWMVNKYTLYVLFFFDSLIFQQRCDRIQSNTHRPIILLIWFFCFDSLRLLLCVCVCGRACGFLCGLLC